MGSKAELECMAKLVSNKFKIASIDWKTFSDTFTNKQCKDEVAAAMKLNNFNEAQKILDEQIRTITELSKSPSVTTFCK